MKIAFYGRFSSDSQRETSIEDQFRLIERWAQRQGTKIVAKFSDLAISGASLKLLPGLQSALKAATSGPAPFDAIVVDQLSRLSRDVGDTDAIIKRLRFRGVGVIAVSDNINTSDETTKINVTAEPSRSSARTTMAVETTPAQGSAPILCESGKVQLNTWFWVPSPAT